jgi:hypothetical protein
MDQLIKRLPDELENEIKNLVYTKSTRLIVLLDKYPLVNMNTFLQQFSKEQLDRIYRYGCVSKVLEWDNGYTHSGVNPSVKKLFKNEPFNYSLFTHTCWPTAQFNYYWQSQIKRCQPSKPDYIRRISRFCGYVFAFSRLTSNNEKLIQFCEKIVYDVIVGCLIISRG